MKRSILSTLAVGIVVGLLTGTSTINAQERPGSVLQRLNSGDVNGDGKRDISDTIYLLNWLFAGGPAPIKPEGDDPAAEVLARIQASAVATLATLPTEEQIAKLPARISNGFLKARKVFTAAARDALQWSPKDLRHYAVSVELVAVFIGIVNPSLCQLFPEACIDEECIEKCRDAAEACNNGCPSTLTDPIGAAACMIDCSTELVQCGADCINWSAI